MILPKYLHQFPVFKHFYRTLLVSLPPLNLLSQLSCSWDPPSKQLPEAKPQSPVYTSSPLLLIQSIRTPCNISFLPYWLPPKITSLSQSSILESACIYSGDLCECIVCDVQQHLAIEIFVINLGTEFDTIFILREPEINWLEQPIYKELLSEFNGRDGAGLSHCSEGCRNLNWSLPLYQVSTAFT